MNKILVVGLGKVGSLVGTLLSKRFSVTGLDKAAPASLLPFSVASGDISQPGFLNTIMQGFDAVIEAIGGIQTPPVVGCENVLLIVG